MLGGCIACSDNGLFPAMLKIKGSHLSDGSRRRDAAQDRRVEGARPKDCSFRRGQRVILNIEAAPAGHDVMRRMLDQGDASETRATSRRFQPTILRITAKPLPCDACRADVLKIAIGLIAGPAVMRKTRHRRWPKPCLSQLAHLRADDELGSVRLVRPESIDRAEQVGNGILQED